MGWFNAGPVTDGKALDLMSEWLCQPDAGGQWGSAADFIEYAASLVERTGRSTDPVPEDDEED